MTKQTIENNTFNDLVVGEFFLYDGNMMEKIDTKTTPEGTINAIECSQYEGWDFEGGEEVIKL